MPFHFLIIPFNLFFAKLARSTETTLLLAANKISGKACMEVAVSKQKTNSDALSFQALMQHLTPDFLADIQPLTSEASAVTSFAIAKNSNHAIRRQAATFDANTDPGLGLSDEVRVWIEPEGIMEWRHDGIQTHVLRKLKQGRYAYAASLDLHKMLVKEARVELAQFIQTCYRRSIRTALIIHGKGARSKDRPALLKSLCYQWLIDLPYVQAFHTAQPQHGGAGATYVIIRKSETSKLETREQYSKR